MKRELLLVVLCCSIFFISCSTEDVDKYNFKPGLVDQDSNSSFDDIPDNTADSKIIDPVILITSKNSIVAHRGAWQKNNYPQNSIASLREAIRLECKGAEFDILLTADDSLVVNHDEKYNNRIVQNSKYSDLVTLKLFNGEKLPTLREYILAGKENNTTTQLFCEFKNYGLSLDRKKTFVEKTLELVNNLKAKQLMVYISFDYDLLKQIRALEASANVQYLNNGKISPLPQQIRLDNITGINYYHDVYKSDPKWIESARTNGLTLNVYTVNTVGDLNWFLKNNIDAILTDDPELALSIKIH